MTNETKPRLALTEYNLEATLVLARNAKAYAEDMAAQGDDCDQGVEIALEHALRHATMLVASLERAAKRMAK